MSLSSVKKINEIFQFVFDLSKRYGIKVQSEKEKKKLLKFDINMELEFKKNNSLCYIIGNICHYVWSRRKRKSSEFGTF